MLMQEYYDFVTGKTPADSVAIEKRIVFRVMEDLRGRGGMWENIDYDVEEEIVAELIEVVKIELEQQ